MQITNISAQKYFLQDFLQSEISISSLDYFNWTSCNVKVYFIIFVTHNEKQFSRQFMIENFCSDQGLEKNEILMYTRILCNYQRLNYIWKYLQALILHSVVELVLQEGSKIKFLFFPLISPLGKTVFDISSMRRQQLFHQVISDSEVRKKNHTQKRNEEKKKENWMKVYAFQVKWRLKCRDRILDSIQRG